MKRQLMTEAGWNIAEAVRAGPVPHASVWVFAATSMTCTGDTITYPGFGKRSVMHLSALPRSRNVYETTVGRRRDSGCVDRLS
jgi:hypothetical protein